MFLQKFCNLLRNGAAFNVTNVLKNSFSTSSHFACKVQQQKLELQNKTVEKVENPIKKINEQLKNDKVGRLFAVVQLCGKQFKVTDGDLIVVEGYWAPTISDQIRLDKVLVAGSQDFSLIGRPLIQKGLVDVQAQIIEKSLSHTRTHFKKKRRKQYQRINFYRSPTTMIRINSINFTNLVDQKLYSPDNLTIY